MNKTHTIIVKLEDGSLKDVLDDKGKVEKFALAVLDNKTSAITKEQYINFLNNNFDQKIVDIKLINSAGRVVPFVFSDGFINVLSKYAIDNNTTTILSTNLVTGSDNQEGFVELENFVRLLVRYCTNQEVLQSFNTNLVPNAEGSPLYKIGELLKAYKRDFDKKDESLSNDMNDTFIFIERLLNNYNDIRKVYLWTRDLGEQMSPISKIEPKTPQEEYQITLFEYLKSRNLPIKVASEEKQEEKENTLIEEALINEALEESRKAEEEFNKRLQEAYEFRKKSYSEDAYDDYSIPDEEWDLGIPKQR